MPSYEHNKLIDRISHLDELPEAADEYATWIKADGHLTLLRDNAKEDELIIYGSGDSIFIHAVVVRENNISPLDKDDLLHWSDDPFEPCASYTYGGGNDGVWIERTGYPRGSKTLEDAQQLVFARIFEGLKGKDALYYEILQEYSHLTGIHWRPEQHAYCSFDDNGDFDNIVSITSKEKMKLVSFKREPLELYLAASNSVLVQMFDFTLLRRGNFDGWPAGDEARIVESDVFFYRQKVIDEYAGYTRGIQIVCPSRPKEQIFSDLKKQWSGHKDAGYVEFIAHDWRNECITEISTDPIATTNYFQAQENSLPLELSPAFFRPDVLLKYKGDSDKYTVDERNIYCRGGWRLRDYDVNEAGQVHAYICDLRNLPYQEQLHWKSYNEKPKTGISERAFTNHFKGEWVDPDSFENVLFIARKWTKSDLTWWKLREEVLLEQVSTPRTVSRDEWARAFMGLSKLIIEGFQIKTIRKKLEEMNIAFQKEEKSLVLLEKFLIGHHKINDGQRLEGLRTIQHIRSIFAHAGSNEANDLANHALQEHGTYSEHFKSICEILADELRLIEQAFS